ncbi:MAG: lysylphosphatidylglycerol synthase transmembrane domain-containing protein [Bacteroidetes bacterium]|nr:lysylphosphatidylglycerol synthase transmembrane domain-containing protein [Bacteroidota bacterium]MDE2671067.1 lysylphosphatidylglycerol synthase transmembrane domain-containing protein [Bacteroidota bacterium]
MTYPIRLRTLALRLLSILVAVFLIWLSLRGVDFAEFVEAMRSAHYIWIIPVVVATLFSHWIRAYRWQVLVAAVPDDSSSRIPTLELFASVMIGYMVNYALPRVGEVARCTHLSTRHRLSFPALLGTVAVERIADILVLGLGLIITALFLRGRLQSMFELVTLPQFPWIWIGICCLILAIVIYFGLRLNAASPLRTKFLSLIAAFVDGLKSIVRTPQRWRLGWTTALMWLTYGLMAYIPILMFDLQSSASLSYWDGLAIMFIGVLGILVPTPGGAGSFHYITVLTLTAVYGIAQPDAAAYAVFVHGAQLFLYLATGALVLSLKPSGPSSAHHNVA